jgi:hypothetical protein
VTGDGGHRSRVRRFLGDVTRSFGTPQIAAEDDRRALAGRAVECEDIATATHDRKPAAALGVERGELGIDDELARKTDTVVLDRCHDPIRADTYLDHDRSLRFRVLHRVRKSFTESGEKVRQIVLADAPAACEIEDAFANHAGEVWLGRHPEIDGRFRTTH